jgi:hypothetical protein
MTATALSPSPNADRAYVRLRREIEAVLITGRAKVEAAWVGTYHETGRLIHEHVLKAKARADYGAKLLERLSTDTAVSVRTLRECSSTGCSQFGDRSPNWVGTTAGCSARSATRRRVPGCWPT